MAVSFVLRLPVDFLKSVRPTARLTKQGAPGLMYSTKQASKRTESQFQETQMKEMCIVVDEEDKVIGSESKRACHQITTERNGLLHRAFSVFLFNTKGELLLQQRADSKITFPGYYTNTCCSHPLYIPDELDGPKGVLNAAQRRLNIELGININDIPISDMVYLTRIHYEAEYTEKWIEREIDYIIFLQKDVSVKPHPEEIKELKYVKQSEIGPFLKQLKEKDIPITPWFSLIQQTYLDQWWKDLTILNKWKDHLRIQRLLD